ncbi:MAG: O-antigen ligase [Patescibacteria group bacterium]|nr:O-antigen ligase [Patescibacteria group bacterium]
METILILLLFIATAIISLLVLYISAGTFKILTLPTVWFIFYSICIYIRAPQIFFENGATNTPYLWAVLSGLLLFPIGAVAANIFFRFHPKKEINKYLSSPLVDSQKKETFRLVFFLMVAVCLIVVLIYFIKIKIGSALPFLALIKGYGEQAISTRISITNLFPHFWRYRFIFSTVIPLLSIIALLKMFTSPKEKIFWRNTFIILITIPALIFISLGFKLYFGILFFLIFLAVTLAKNNLNFKSILLIIFIILLAFIGTYLLSLGFDENVFFTLMRIFRALFNRATYAYSNILYYIFQVFPFRHDYLYKLYLPNPGRIFSFESFSLPSYMHKIMNPESFGGSSPTVFFGGIYASLGYLGMLLSIPLVGFLFQTIQIYFIRRKKSIINVTFLIILCYYALFTAVSSIFDFFSLILIVLTFIFLFLKAGPIILYKIIKD